MTMKSKILALILGVLTTGLLKVSMLAAQEATIVLKNTQRIEGKVLQDVSEHMIVLSDLGEVKINRSDIEHVLYKSDELDEKLDGIDPFKDLVIVHTNDNEAITGVMVAKGASAIIVNTDLGRMTIPKTKVKLIEYVSKEYAERGEPVRVKLQSGQDLEGYLYHEDRNSLTMSTRQGRLTIEKANLRSISYNVPIIFSMPRSSGSSYAATAFEDPYSAIPLREKQDSFDFGFAPNFSENFSTGGSFVYRHRFILKYQQTYSLNMEANLGIAGFGLNKDVLVNDQVPGAVNAKGGAMVTTLAAGTPLHFYPVEGSSYEFYIAPMLEMHVVYQSLNITYPSFPSLDTVQQDTKLRFGLGSRIGMELAVARTWRVGMSFNMHYLFGESDFNTISLHIGTQLF